MMLSLLLLLAGCIRATQQVTASGEAQTHEPKPASTARGMFYVVPIVTPGSCKPNNGIINTQDPRPFCPQIWASEPRDPVGWRRVELPTYSMAMPPDYTGGATGEKTMLFDGPDAQLSLKDDVHAPHPRCTFGKLCYRDYTHIVGGIETESALEDWRETDPKGPRPWRYFAVQHNVYGAREPVIAVEAHCKTREFCERIDILLKQLRMKDGGAPLKAGDRNTPSEPEHQSAAAYKAGLHKRHDVPTPKGWKRFDHEGTFSMAVPEGLKATWDGDGEGGTILIVAGDGLDFTVARSWYIGYAQCSERVACVRERTTIDGLPATAMWDDWSGLEVRYLKEAGLHWNYSAAVRLPSGHGPSGSLILQAAASCRTRAICEQAKAMIRTIEIH